MGTVSAVHVLNRSNKACCVYYCKELAEWVVGNATTERLNETWAPCTQHVPVCVRYITERDAAWGEPLTKVVVVELSRARS